MPQAIETTQGTMTASDLRDRLIAQASDSDEFRARPLADPKAVRHDKYGIVVPENVKLHVHEDDILPVLAGTPASPPETADALICYTEVVVLHDLTGFGRYL